MKTLKIAIATLTLSGVALLANSQVMATGETGKEMLTSEQAIEMAKEKYPGEVIKAYKEINRGREVWEVQIQGENGRKGEFYYDMATHELVKSEIDDD